MDGAALPAFINVLAMKASAQDNEVVIPADEAQQQLFRAALWGITTWLGAASLSKRALFIRLGGLAVLLQVRKSRRVGWSWQPPTSLFC